MGARLGERGWWVEGGGRDVKSVWPGDLIRSLSLYFRSAKANLNGMKTKKKEIGYPSLFLKGSSCCDFDWVDASVYALIFLSLQ